MEKSSWFGEMLSMERWPQFPPSVVPGPLEQPQDKLPLPVPPQAPRLPALGPLTPSQRTITAMRTQRHPPIPQATWASTCLPSATIPTALMRMLWLWTSWNVFFINSRRGDGLMRHRTTRSQVFFWRREERAEGSEVCLSPGGRTWVILDFNRMNESQSQTPLPEWAGKTTSSNLHKMGSHLPIWQLSLCQGHLETATAGVQSWAASLWSWTRWTCLLLFQKGPLAIGGCLHHQPETLNAFLLLPIVLCLPSLSALFHINTIIKSIFTILDSAFRALYYLMEILQCFTGQEYGKHCVKFCRNASYYLTKIITEANI